MGNRIKRTKSAGGIVINQIGKIALIQNRKGGGWFFPKGHVEKGETFLKAAKREIDEEAGLKDIQFIKKLGSYRRHPIRKDGSEEKLEIKIITMFLFKTNQRRIKPVKVREVFKAKWTDKEKVAGLLFHPKDKEFFLKIKNKI